MGFNLGLDDLLSIPTMGGYSGLKAATGGATDVKDLGEGVKDFQRVGMNGTNATPYDYQDQYFGGDPQGANRWSGMGINAMNNSNADAAWAHNQASWDRGPQAMEDQTLANNEASARNGDQSGALQLAREAAMGNAPSEAAYQMQGGLNQAIAGQQAMAGSARGAAALANAQGNAAGNIAGLQQNAFNQGGQLRAAEMANARNAYGGLAGQQREQDLSRMAQGNQMGQFNANLNDQYRLGMGQLANANANTSLGYYNASMQPQQAQMQTGLQNQQARQGGYQNAQALNAGVSQANADLANQNKQQMVGFAGGLLKTGVDAGMAGSKKG